MKYAHTLSVSQVSLSVLVVRSPLYCVTSSSGTGKHKMWRLWNTPVLHIKGIEVQVWSLWLQAIVCASDFHEINPHFWFYSFNKANKGENKMYKSPPIQKLMIPIQLLHKFTWDSMEWWVSIFMRVFESVRELSASLSNFWALSGFVCNLLVLICTLKTSGLPEHNGDHRLCSELQRVPQDVFLIKMVIVWRLCVE